MKDKNERREAYMQKLRDPRWQKKRLEIMQRDNFICQRCYDGEITLNVHHNLYRSGYEPWDYPNETLVTLCEECHRDETLHRRDEEELLLLALRQVGASWADVNNLACNLVRAFGFNERLDERDEHALHIFLHFFETLKPAVTAWREERLKEHKASNEPQSDRLGASTDNAADAKTDTCGIG